MTAPQRARRAPSTGRVTPKGTTPQPTAGRRAAGGRGRSAPRAQASRVPPPARADRRPAELRRLGYTPPVVSGRSGHRGGR